MVFIFVTVARVRPRALPLNKSSPSISYMAITRDLFALRMSIRG